MENLAFILIIDDDEISNSITTAMIHNIYEDIEIRTVLNGFEAQEYFMNNPENIPDLVFLDINMPIMNGFKFLDWYEKSSFIGSTKICMLTSSLHFADKVKARGYTDVVGYIEKPLQYGNITAFLKSL